MRAFFLKLPQDVSDAWTRGADHSDSKRGWQVLTLGIVGAGHWGPNLVRCFHAMQDVVVKTVVDLAEDRLALIRERFSSVQTSTDIDALLTDPEIDAVVIATPLSTHYELASRALAAGKHVFVEKPLCGSVDEGLDLVTRAAAGNRILAVGHVFLFNNGIRRVREAIVSGELGSIQHIHATRTNLGPYRNDANALWDLSSHDLSIFDYWMGAAPITVSASGGSFLRANIEDVVAGTFAYASGAIAGTHASWLNPYKVRQITVVGDKKMATWDDMNLLEPVRFYDKSMVVDIQEDCPRSHSEFIATTREGDIQIPKVAAGEPLAAQCRHFVDCIRTGATPLNDGMSAVRIVSQLSAATESMLAGGLRVKIEEPQYPESVAQVKPAVPSPPEAAPIPLVDVRAQIATFESEIRGAVEETLLGGDFILGKAVTRFEEEFASFCGSDSSVGVGSGTDALQLACRALDVGYGDEVIVPAFTFFATALAVSNVGATPVLVDVDPQTGLIDTDRIEAAITLRTRAVIPVHIFGQCCDLDPILAIASQHNLAVIEDAAQAHGARYNDRPAGSMGTLGCFSFYPGKNLGACGDGGAVVTSDSELAARLRGLRSLGATRKHEHEELGQNSRLDTLQAAILRVKLPHLERWNEKRRKIANHYTVALAGHPGLRLLRREAGRTHAFHLYVVLTEYRDQLVKELNEAGIGAGIHYPKPIHFHAPYRHLGLPGDYPAAEEIARTCMSLPLYPEMAVEQVERVCLALIKARARVASEVPATRARRGSRPILNPSAGTLPTR